MKIQLYNRSFLFRYRYLHTYLGTQAPGGSWIRFGHRHTRTEATPHPKPFPPGAQGAKGVRHLFFFSVRLSLQNILVVKTFIGCCLAMMIHHRSDILLDLAAQFSQALSRHKHSCAVRPDFEKPGNPAVGLGSMMTCCLRLACGWCRWAKDGMGM